MNQGGISYFDRAAATWDDNPSRIALMKAVGEAILREVQPTTEMRVLDYGCGTGLVGLFLLPYVGSVTGADNSVGMLEVLRQKIRDNGLASMRAVHLDLEHDLAPTDRYDLIVSSMTLHHIADTGKVLEACCQLLNPRGILCVADLAPEPGAFHPPEAARSVHHHGFDPKELASQLSRLGFRHTQHITAHSIRKPVDGGAERDFPVFLITARKEPPDGNPAVDDASTFSSRPGVGQRRPRVSPALGCRCAAIPADDRAAADRRHPGQSRNGLGDFSLLQR